MRRVNQGGVYSHIGIFIRAPHESLNSIQLFASLVHVLVEGALSKQAIVT